MTDLADLGLAAAADGIRRRRFSAWDVTQACLARVSAWQKHVNAFIAIDHGGALKTAAQADSALGRGMAAGALHGVPLAHKDIFSRANMVASIGSRIPSAPAAETATVLARLDAAGAIELGALNMVEFAAGPTGHNAHFGDCRNPWNPERITGGSSSGSAAALAARMAMGALGTDTGGSVRVPGHACGVVGLRPTYGRISRHGVFPRAWSLDTVGPMARTVEDVALLLQIIAGPDPKDADAEAVAVPNYLAEIAKPLAGLRIGVAHGAHWAAVDGGIAALLEAAHAAFAKLGAAVSAVETPDPAPLTNLAITITRAEAAALHADWMKARPQDYGAGILDATESGLFVPALHYIDAQRLRGRLLKHWLDAVFAKVDVLMTPVFGLPTPTLADSAPASGTDAIGAGWGRFTWPFAYLGLPALAVPVGFQPDAMPAAMQLVAKPFAEALLLNAGHLYQRETGWHEKAPTLPG